MPNFMTYHGDTRKTYPFRQAITMRIPNGDAYSQDFCELDDCYTVVAIDMPDAWTAANIAFQTCTPANGVPDSQVTPIALTAFKLINEPDSTDYLEIQVAAGEVTYIDPGKLAAFRFLRIVSMTDGAEVAQGAAREVVLYVRPI